NVLKGELVNQSGRPVNIAQVLAAYYDDSGKVIWVSDGYVDQALMPQVPVPFAVDIPNDIAGRLKTYRVIVNHYSQSSSKHEAHYSQRIRISPAPDCIGVVM